MYLINTRTNGSDNGASRHMEITGPTLARIPMLNGIFLLQIQIYGKYNVLYGL